MFFCSFRLPAVLDSRSVSFTKALFIDRVYLKTEILVHCYGRWAADCRIHSILVSCTHIVSFVRGCYRTAQSVGVAHTIAVSVTVTEINIIKYRNAAIIRSKSFKLTALTASMIIVTDKTAAKIRYLIVVGYTARVNEQNTPGITYSAIGFVSSAGTFPLTEIYAAVTSVKKTARKARRCFAVDYITIINSSFIRSFKNCAGRTGNKTSVLPNMRPARNKRRNTVVALWWISIVLVVIVADAALSCVVIGRFITDHMYTGDKRERRKLRLCAACLINVRRSRTCQEVKLRIIHICISIGMVGSALDNVGCRDLDRAVSYRGCATCDRLLYYLIGAGVFRHIRRHRIAPIYSNRCTSRRTWEINRTCCLRCASAKRSVLIAVDKILEGIRLGACTNHRIEINRLRNIELYSRFNGVDQLLDIDNGLWLREQNARVKDKKRRCHEHKNQQKAQCFSAKFLQHFYYLRF